MAGPGSSYQALALSDEIVPYIHSPTIKDRFGEVDLVLGCGDLPREYLEFVVSLLDKPLFFVPGNHDVDEYCVPGGRSIDGTFAKYDRMLIAGAGGSIRYKPEGRHQYTQRQMYQRVLPMLPRMLLRRIIHGRRLDVFVAHASPRGVQDASDPAHTGFNAFHALIKIGRPRYLVHGHTHIHRNLEPSETRIDDTWVVNVYPQRVLDL
jgi:Icc-related predicted phosphoesterase